jgi:hypothetical protein
MTLRRVPMVKAFWHRLSMDNDSDGYVDERKE